MREPRMDAFTDEKDKSGYASSVKASCGALPRRCVPNWINDGDMELSREDQWLATKTCGEVVCARATVRLVPSIRWDAEKVGVINVTPFDFTTRTQDVIEEDPEPHSHPGRSPDEGATRRSKRLKIFDSDLKDFGYTENCQR